MDWKIIIRELIDTGMTQKEIAERVLTVQSNISGLLTGEQTEPRWGLGDRLLKLHRSRCRLRLRRAVRQQHPQSHKEAA